MKKPSKNYIFVIVVSIIFVTAYFFGPRAQQNKILEASNKLKIEIRNDHKFSRLKFHQSTNWKRPLKVWGEVNELDDLKILKALIRKHSLKNGVSLDVKIKD